MSEQFNRVIEQAAACLKSNAGARPSPHPPLARTQPRAGEHSPLLDSFAAFVRSIEAMFNARRFLSLDEVRLHCTATFFLCASPPITNFTSPPTADAQALYFGFTERAVRMGGHREAGFAVGTRGALPEHPG